MKSIIPINQDVVWTQYVECDKKQQVWLAVAAKWTEQTKVNPFGIKMRAFEGAYRLCINGEIQRAERYTGFAAADQSNGQLLDMVTAAAIGDFCARTNSVYPDDFKCWNLTIVSSSAEFLESIAEQIKDENDYYGLEDGRSHVQLSLSRTVTTAQIEPDDEAQVFGRDRDFKIFIP